MVSVFETVTVVAVKFKSDSKSAVDDDSGNVDDDVDACVAGDVTVVVNSFNLFESQLFGTFTPNEANAEGEKKKTFLFV